MLFHRRDVMMTIMLSLISVKIFTVNGVGDESADGGNQGADVSGFQTAENVSASVEVYNEYTTCWKDMKSFSESNKPEAIHFVKMGITNWTDEDFYDMPHLSQYYHSFRDFLDPKDILYPEDFCLIFGSGVIPSDTEEEEEEENSDTKCQKALKEFGITNHDALQYGFYETKIEEIIWDEIDDPVMLTIYLVMDNDKYYSKKYLRYMATHVKLHSGYQSPLEFCKAYDAQMMEEMNIPQNT